MYASGYRIPEQSLGAVAKAGANVATTNGADASYYNPANMSFLEDKNYIETTLTYIHLPSINYEDSLGSQYGLDGKSKKENFLLPTVQYVSESFYDDFRFGLSLSAPGGLAKRWSDTYAKAYAKKFSLKIFELNPTLSYKINDYISAAVGARLVYIDGVVQSEGSLGRDLEGDSFDLGYNIALSVKPIEPLTLAATYRSNVDMTVKGAATLSNVVTGESYDGDAAITIPLPAVLSLAASYDFGKTVVELEYEKTYWSKYHDLDFDYERDMSGTGLAVFDAPSIKKWKNSDAYRIGVSHELTDKVTLYGGFAIDKTPANEKYLSFELPDSDAKLYSFGVSYKLYDNTTLGFAYLYDRKKERTSVQRADLTNPTSGIYGTYKDASAHLVSLSLQYEF